MQIGLTAKGTRDDALKAVPKAYGAHLTPRVLNMSKLLIGAAETNSVSFSLAGLT